MRLLSLSILGEFLGGFLQMFFFSKSFFFKLDITAHTSQQSKIRIIKTGKKCFFEKNV
jgi:hypothetical protein